MVISWSAKIGVFYDKNYRDFTKHGWRFFYKNFGSARIIWPWKLHLLASSMKILDAKRRECMGMWENWMMVTIGILYGHPWTIPPFFTLFGTKNLPSFPMFSPCRKRAVTGQRHQRDAHAAQHGPYCPARCLVLGEWVLWNEFSEWEKPGDKSDQKMKHVGDCW